jgi:hypothetical protein
LPVVTVNPINSINVRVGRINQAAVSTTSTFTGAASANVQSALTMAEAALAEANTAYALANNSLQTTGGEVTGNLTVDGTFTAVIDGGIFS